MGYGYGSVEIAGNTVGQAKLLIEQHLLDNRAIHRCRYRCAMSLSSNPSPENTWLAQTGPFPLANTARFPLVGLTLDEARMAIADHLSPYFANPQVSVSVYAFNSKVYYIVTQGVEPATVWCGYRSRGMKPSWTRQPDQRIEATYPPAGCGCAPTTRWAGEPDPPYRLGGNYPAG
ncbi:MAG: hypothetical protein R3C56_08340 [Pirellulaceae bacterium]